MSDGIGKSISSLGPYELNSIITGDARELVKEIPDDSIDMVFTDPPYHKEHLPLYGFLAQECPRILRAGAWAFIYGGWVAKEVFDLLYAGKWDYFMTIALVNRGGYPRWWSKKLMIGYKPVYVFVNGTPKIHKWQSNIADSDEMDKRYHAWGQGVGLAVEKIDMFTNPGDVVLDLFCGGGQTPEACITTGRNYLAFEIDSETAKKALERVKNAQPPLFVPEMIQRSMEI